MNQKTRVALVTGGTRGIGRAIARRLASEGFHVAISGSSQKSVDRAQRSFVKEGLDIRGFPADARSYEEQRKLVGSVEKEFGRLDLLVNNAGIAEFGSIDRLSPEKFRAVIETNLFGPYYAIHAAVPLMKKGGGGFIVNIASLASINSFAGGSAYNASKFGLLGLSEAAMLDLRHNGIRVAAVLPGSVATEFDDSHGGKENSWMLSPEDVAEAVSSLVRFPERALPSRIELRPTRPPKKS